MRLWSLRARLMTLTLTLFAGIFFVGFLGFYSTKNLSQSLHHTVENSLPSMRHLILIDMVHDGVRGVALEALLGAMQKDPEKIQTAETDLTNHEKNAHESFGEIESRPMSPGFQERYTPAKEEVEKYLETTRILIAKAKNSPLPDVENQFTHFQEQFDVLEEKLGALGEYFEKESSEASLKTMSASNRLQWTLLFALISTTILGLFISYFIGRTLIRSLNEITLSLSTGAVDTTRAIGQLSSASNSLSSATNQQASAIQETAASIEEISAMVRKSSENAVQSEKVSNHSRERAEEGHSAINQMMTAIHEISLNNDRVVHEVSESNNRLTEVVKVIQEIESKTTVINDIVFQTKLLSFNASVEAARAGEYGKGFAVVAEEVGNLAAMSGNASKEISSLLERSLSHVDNIVKETKGKVETMMVETKKTVDRGVKMAEQCGEILNDIVQEAKKVSDMVSTIATASQEQSNGVEEISRAIAQLNQVTQTNATAAADCTGISDFLTTQVQQLQTSATSLNQIVKGPQGDPQNSRLAS